MSDPLVVDLFAEDRAHKVFAGALVSAGDFGSWAGRPDMRSLPA